MKIHYCFALAIAVVSCGKQISNSKLQEQIDEHNDPRNIPASGQYEYSFDRLPSSGKSRSVWTGNYWPSSEGGTAHRASSTELSPMEKYDRATNNGGNATKWELEEVRRNAGTSWAGHCNGLAAAGIRTKEPQRAVTYNGVTFSTTDIKALLVEVFQGAGSIVGGRSESNSPSHDGSGRQTTPDCRDLNPGSLHLALTNFIGLHGQPFVVDISPAMPVWNYPVVGYSYSASPISAQQAQRLVSGQNGNYSYNSRAQQFQHVSLRIELVQNTVKRYEYVIELDSNNQVLGGEWIGSSQADHPDFVWNATNAEPANPYIDAEVVKNIYRQSI